MRVEVQVARARFADVLGEMREWLDRHGRPLVRFETESDGGPMITIKVQCDDTGLTEDFRAVFRGSYAD